MSISPSFKNVEKLFSIFIFSAILASVTFCAVIIFGLPITTPGMAVLGYAPNSLKLGDRLLVILAVDSLIYSLLMYGLISLFRLRIGKRK